MEMKTVLTIAGSDTSAGAGIQQDLKTITAMGLYALTVPTALTAQNTRGVQRVMPVPEDMVRAQIDSIFDDIRIDAVKIGMIPDIACARVVTSALRGRNLPVVYDPVMVSTSGHPLMTPDCMEYVMEELFPLCTVVTPNLPESVSVMAYLTKAGLSAEACSDLAGEVFVRHFGTAFLLKGGHAEGEVMRDILYEADGRSHEYTTERIHSNNLHGTGCTLSSAIACGLACGLSLSESVRNAKKLVYEAIAAAKGLSIGSGNGPLLLTPIH